MEHLLNKDKIELNCPVEQLINLFYSYKEKGFESSAFTILLMACRQASTTEEIRATSKILNEVIFRSNNIELVKSILVDEIKPMICGKGKLPVLMFHLYGWLYGGAERALTTVTNHLTHKFKVIITVFEPIKNTGFILSEKTAFIPIYGEEQRIERLVLLTKLLRPDIFIGNNNSIPELFQIYPLLDEEGIKTIAYSHEYFFFPHNHHDLFTSITDKNYALAKASAACFLTGFSANAYGLINNNAAIMPNPNTFQNLSNDYFNPNGKTILAVGRFSDAIKRLDRVIKAFKLVLSRHPDAKLVVVGPYNLDARIPINSNETISELIKRLEFKDSQLVFVGEQEQTADYYKNADAFVMTSDNEGFALVLTEAGSFGLPAVIFSIPGLDDIVSEGINGFIVPQDDISGMADRLSDILEDVKLRKRMSEKAYELSARFSIESIGTRWEKLINVILSRNSQEEINEILSSEFINQVSDYSAFAQQIVNEYEKISVKISNYQTQLAKETVSIFPGFDIATQKLKFNIKNYGYQETFKKIFSKSKKLIRRCYYRVHWRRRY